MNRKKYKFLILSLIAMLCLGSTYSWSNFVVPLEELFGWKRPVITFAYTLNTSFFGIGSLLAGYWNQKGQYRKCYVLSGVLMGIGYFAISHMHHWVILYVFYSAMTGIANGLGFVTVMTCAAKLFDAQTNMISGILSMTLGMSSFLISPTIVALNEKSGILRTFTVMAIAVGGGLTLCAVLSPVPSAGSAAKTTPKVKHYGAYELSFFDDLKKLLQQRDAMLYCIWAMLFTACGLGYISQIAACALDIGVSVALSAYIVGAFSVCSGLGRLLFGKIYDMTTYGWGLRLIAIINLIGTSLLVGAVWGQNTVLLALGTALAGTAYGGTMVSNTIMPRFLFRRVPYSFSLGVINNTGLPGSLLGHFMVAVLMEQSGSYLMPFIVLLMVVLVNVVIGERICKNALQ